jgi:hypothetical protein
MEETMTARSVAWDTGEAIPGSPFRRMITAADTGRRFSTLFSSTRTRRPGPSSLTQRRRRILLRIPRTHRRSYRRP